MPDFRSLSCFIRCKKGKPTVRAPPSALFFQIKNKAEEKL